MQRLFTPPPPPRAVPFGFKLIALIVLIAALAFTGCDGGEDPADTPTLYTVTFDGNGFTGTVPAALTQTAEGGAVTLPAASAAGLGTAVLTWNTRADGSGTDHAAGSFTPAANSTLYVKIASFPFATGQQADPDIKEKFGITDTTAAGVKAAFTAVHQHIASANFATGNYIDLPSLTIGSDPVINDVPLSGNGRLLRLMVVGKNSFNGINDNDTPHVVFQFLNVPVTHNMNDAPDTNVGGYKLSAMRTYIMGDFLTGLKTATGLTDAMLWGPTRTVSKGGYPEAGADTVRDTLWLPTEWEMFGAQAWSSPMYEPSTGQARLEYYGTGIGRNMDRKKYNRANTAEWYRLASTHTDSAVYFCIVDPTGDAAYHYASTTGGCAPAFCVK